MSVAVLSDIHANVYALQAVIEDLPANIEEIWFLGDLLGYGPHPGGTWRKFRDNILQKKLTWSVKGNQDAAYLTNGLDRITSMNDLAELALSRNERALEGSEEDREIRKFIEEQWIMASPQAGIYMAHGFGKFSISEPQEIVDDYMDNINKAEMTLNSLKLWLTNPTPANFFGHNGHCNENPWPTPALILIGHTHQQAAWKKGSRGWRRLFPGFGVPAYSRSGVPRFETDAQFLSTPSLCEFQDSILDPNEPTIINVGSVGYPRDGFYEEQDHSRALAKYVVLDLNGENSKVEFRTVTYQVAPLVSNLIEYDYPLWPEIGEIKL